MGSYLGFDPGGSKGFGVALLRGTEMLVGTVSTIDEAVAWAREHCDESPYAAGIDSLLHWSTGNGRAVDWLLRRFAPYKASRLSVVSQNSLYGSMVIGGMGLAYRLREVWPELILNETHPKLLYYALTKDRYPRHNIDIATRWLAQASGIQLTVNNDHEFDAAISAWATKVALEAAWPDIIDPTDPAVLKPIGGVRYFWPEQLTPAGSIVA